MARKITDKGLNRDELCKKEKDAIRLYIFEKYHGEINEDKYIFETLRAIYDIGFEVGKKSTKMTTRKAI